MSDIKYMDIKEFLEKGFLQEVNRLVLHPAGLAMAVAIDEDGEEFLYGVWDYREDPEGITYDYANGGNDSVEARRKQFSVIEETQKHRDARVKLFGSVIEPIVVRDES